LGEIKRNSGDVGKAVNPVICESTGAIIHSSSSLSKGEVGIIFRAGGGG
jgi:hypothetical protein